MSYTDPLRIYLHGDKEKAKQFVREARRLAFLLLRQTTESGATTARRRWKSADGTTVEVIIIPGQVTAIITAPSVDKKAERKFEDFVVWARTQALPDGIDPDHPQQILRPAWKTFFYDDQIPLYADFGRPKGTYRRNPDGTALFPDGITHAGNIDWRGPNKERLSWYGPISRYWYDAWRQPSAQYGKFVFHLGQVLLDVAQFQIDNEEVWDEQLVLGACVREHEDGRWLYVVLADIPDQVTPVVSVPPNTLYVTQNYPLGDIIHAVRRIRLSRDTDAQEAQKWRLVGGSQLLWRAIITRACSPWMFSLDGRTAYTVAQAATPFCAFSDLLSEELFSAPPASSELYRIQIAEDGTVSGEGWSTSIPAGAGEAVVAMDFAADGTELPVYLGRGPVEQSPHGIYLRVGDTRFPLYFKTNPPSGDFTDSSAECAIVLFDARERFLVTRRLQHSWNRQASPSMVHVGMFVEIYCNGQYQRELVGEEQGSATGVARYDRVVGALESTAAEPVGPLCWLWMVLGQATIVGSWLYLAGLTAGNLDVPFAKADVFGQWKTTGLTAADSDPIADQAVDGFFNTRTDAHGHRSPAAGAAVDGVYVLSIYHPLAIYGDQYGRADESYHAVSGSDLRTLTGVQGAKERYHPIWVLGQPIGGEA